MEELRRIEAYKNSTDAELQRYLSTGPIRQLQRIRDLTVKKQVAELIALAQDCSHVHSNTWQEDDRLREWRALAAAEALAQLGLPAVEPIRQAIHNPKGNRSWLIYALGKMPGQPALEVLDAIAAEPSNYNAGNVIAALLSHGEAGKQALRRHGLTDHVDREHTIVEEPIPHPKAGSLPKTLPQRKTKRP